MYRFFGRNIEIPLSRVLNSPAWTGSVLDTLNRETDGSVHLKDIQSHQRTADYCWRVVDAVWSTEDTTITRFRAYDLLGNALPFATFGLPGNVGFLTSVGGLKYLPREGNNFYIPVDNQITTTSTGGYVVYVLDLDYPSEGMAFGLHKTKKQPHAALTISFRLFEMTADYPNG